jgi:hypothetical protein
MEGENQLITKQIALEIGKKGVTVVRNFTETGVYLEMTCENIVANQLYMRQI